MDLRLPRSTDRFRDWFLIGPFLGYLKRSGIVDVLLDFAGAAIFACIALAFLSMVFALAYFELSGILDGTTGNPFSLYPWN